MPIVTLRTLGSVELYDARARELKGLLRQPKRLALLVYLRLALSRGFHRRDSLTDLFWPDLDQNHARAALRKSLHALRRDLGEQTLVARGDEEIRLDEEAVWCDAAVLTSAIENGELSDALSIYRGDFLPGFHVTDASPALSQWMDDQRRRMRAQAAGSASQLARNHESDGDFIGARNWALRAAQLEPTDERIARQLIVTLDRSGDRAGAMQAYESFARRLRLELDVEPSNETRDLVHDLRTRAETAVASSAASGSAHGTVVNRIQRDDARSAALAVAKAAPQPAFGRARGGKRAIGFLAVALTVALGASLLLALRGGRFLGNPPRDPSAVAIFPFRVTSVDPAIAALREGMVDLLAVRLNGAVGPRALDPRITLGVWRSALRDSHRDLAPERALEVAANLGARRVLLGELVAESRQLTLSAALHHRDRAHVIRAAVQGAVDSLPLLIDRLAAQLLILDAGEEPQRVAQLTSASPSALRSFLLAKLAHRTGKFHEAVTHYWSALEQDSSFALAALGLIETSRWYLAASAPQIARARTVAWARRASFNSRDRLSLLMYLGPRYPETSSRNDDLAIRESAVQMVTDRAEFWSELGGILVTWGEMLGVERALERARGALDRGLAIDSSYAPLLFHRWRVAVLQNDLHTARRMARRALELAPDFERAGALRWWLNRVQERARNEGALREQLVRMSDVDLAAVYGWSVELGVPFTHLNRAAERLVQRSVTVEERSRAMWRLYFTHIFQGRPRDASLVRDRLAAAGLLTHASQARVLSAAINSIGARSDAEWVIRELEAHASRPLATAGPEQSDQLNDLCWLGRWYLHIHDVQTATRYSQSLSEHLGQAAAASDSPSLQACALELRAERAHLQNRPDADRLVATLDSAMKTAPTEAAVEGNLAVARLKAARGDVTGALAAVRRRTHFWNYLFFLDAQLLEEARLAKTLGDSQGAIRAYQHYLALRSDPEPSVRPHVQSIRRTLDSLLSAEAR